MADNKSHNNNTNNIPGWQVKNPVSQKPTGDQIQARVDMDPIKLDNLIKQKGVRVKVFRTGYCSNVKSIDAAEHEIDCPYCNGSGFIDLCPIETLAFIQNQTLEQFQGVDGTHAGNTVAMSFLSGIELQYFTLIQLMDFTDIYFQRVARSDYDVDVLKYKAQRVNFITCQGKQYHEGIDYDLNVEGNIKWREDRGPRSKDIYSIHYEACVQFRATQAMHANRFTQIRTAAGVTFVKLPEQWACSKEFLVRRKGINGSDLMPNHIPNYDKELESDDEEP